MYSEFIVDYYCQKLSLITRLIFEFWKTLCQKWAIWLLNFFHLILLHTEH